MRKGTIRKTTASLLTFALVALISFTMLPAVNVSAAGGLSIYTTYPSIAVKPGENVETEITVSNKTGAGMTVKLDVLTLPEGWEAYIEGGGKVVDKLYVGSDPGYVDLTVKVPRDAKEGRYSVVLGASSGGYSDRLTLEYNIKADIDNKGKLTANYNELKGSSNASFKFQVDIRNNKSEAQTYSLGADTERGWQVKFTAKYDSKQIASLPVEANSTASVDIEITPPSMISAGEYVIPIAAASAGETLTTELKVIITGTYGLKLTTPTGRLNAETTAGTEKALDIVLQNTGSSELTAVKLSSWKPEGWNVRFEKDVVDSIAVGEAATVKAYIKPDGKAIAGDYVVEISASSPEASSSAQFRVMVKTSTLWGLAGIIVIALLAAGLYQIFKKYGRR